MELVIEPVKHSRFRALSRQIHNEKKHLNNQIYCVDKPNSNTATTSLTTIRFPEDTRSKNPNYIVLTASQIPKNTTYTDVWSSFSDMCTESVASEPVEHIEYQAGKSIKEKPRDTVQISKQVVAPTIFNVHPLLTGHSPTKKRVATKSTLPQRCKERCLLNSTKLPASCLVHNRSNLKHVPLTEIEFSKSKCMSSKPHKPYKQLSNSVCTANATISWRKYGQHLESVLSIDAYYI